MRWRHPNPTVASPSRCCSSASRPSASRPRSFPRARHESNRVSVARRGAVSRRGVKLPSAERCPPKTPSALGGRIISSSPKPGRARLRWNMIPANSIYRRGGLADPHTRNSCRDRRDELPRRGVQLRRHPNAGDTLFIFYPRHCGKMLADKRSGRLSRWGSVSASPRCVSRLHKPSA